MWEQILKIFFEKFSMNNSENVILRSCDIYFLFKEYFELTSTRDSRKRIHTKKHEKMKRKFFLSTFFSLCLCLHKRRKISSIFLLPIFISDKIIREAMEKRFNVFLLCLIITNNEDIPTQLLAIETNCFTHASKRFLWIFISLHQNCKF